MATAYLKRTPSSPGSNTTGTLSAWIKFSTAGTYNTIIGGNEGSSSTDRSLFAISNDGAIYNQIVDGGTNYYQESTRKLLDPSAWYHIVIQFDTTNVTQADRIKTYVNNELIDDWTVTASWPSSVDIKLWDSAASAEYMIGCRKSSAAYQYFFDGDMAHVHVVDGTVYAPSVFAETDSTSGIWIPITSPSVTYGTNGGFYKFQDKSNYGDDSAGSNDMTMVGTITQTKDNPDDNMCTMNPLDNYYAQYTFSNGNNTITNTGSKGFASATVSLFTGLWYWEIKPTAQPGGDYSLIGIADFPTQGTGASNYLGYTALEWAYYASDGNSRNNQASTSYGDTWTTDDIIGVYLDLNANKLYFGKNGVIQNSGTGINITAAASTTNGYYFPATGYNDTSASVYEHNFGNGYFGTDLIASASADAGGIGQFKYNPSTGTFDGSSKDFRAICATNIATYG
jgi:hypothetical protein